MAVGFWNFVGAGIFGFLINLPIVSYFEIGTVLTSNHGHAALFGVFGMLALAVLVFCLRSLAEDAAWARAERWIRIGFWGMNVGLALMMAVDLFPAGVLQFWDVLQNGYWHARRLTFLMSGTFHTLEWARAAADGVFLVVGSSRWSLRWRSCSSARGEAHHPRCRPHRGRDAGRTSARKRSLSPRYFSGFGGVSSGWVRLVGAGRRAEGDRKPVPGVDRNDHPVEVDELLLGESAVPLRTQRPAHAFPRPA